MRAIIAFVLRIYIDRSNHLGATKLCPADPIARNAG